MNNLSLQKYLLATGLLNNSIQDSLDMIVTDGKFNSASVKRALDTKYPLVMKKSNPIEVVFKDKAKFDIKNSIISTVLTQIQSGKIKTEKANENQLKGTSFIEDLESTEQLKRLRQYNIKITMMIMMMMIIILLLLLLLLPFLIYHRIIHHCYPLTKMMAISKEKI